MKKINLIFLFLFFITIIGCSKKPNPPKWYSQIHKENGYLIATGSAYDKQTAIKNALSNIASQLNVKVSSNLIINKGVHKDYYFKDFYKEVNTKVDNLLITNYKIVKVAKDDINYYVLVKVSKQSVAKTYKNTISNKLNDAKSLLQSKQGLDSVINAYKALKILKTAEKLNSIYVNLTNNSEFNNKITSLKDKINSIIQQNKFYVTTNNSAFKVPTENVFSKYIKIINKANYKIKVKVSLNKQYLLNQYVVNGKATLYIGSKVINIDFIGKSYSSYKEALQFAITNYKNILQNRLSSLF